MIFKEKSMKKVALYCRVSTNQQTVDSQLLQLREVAQQRGYQIVAEYCDTGISGAKGRADRPSLDRMLKDAYRGKFEMVMCWDISRLGRSLSNLIEILNELQAIKVDLLFLQQGLQTDTPTGKLLFGICSSLAEFERELIRERVKAGIANAKAKGKKMGRPTLMNANVVATIKTLREKGESVRSICKLTGVGVGSYYSAMSMV